MTKHERLKAFEMRLDGSNWSEIGRELGYSSTTIDSFFSKSDSGPQRSA